MKKLLLVLAIVSNFGLSQWVVNAGEAPAQVIPADPGELVDWYEGLSEDEKSMLRLEVTGRLTFYCPHCQDYEAQPLLKVKFLKLAVAHARQLLDFYPNDRIYGLGQSPAYIIETAKILQAIKREDAHNIFSVVAFSGNYVKLCERKNLPVCYLQRKRSPSPKQIHAYRDYLTSIGLDPATIVEDYNDGKGAKTVIVDFAESGEGLMSFIILLKNWAKELGLNKELIQALRTEIFVTKYKQPPLALFPNSTKHQVNEDFMYALAESDIFDDRLAMHYPFRNWAEEYGPHAFTPSRNAQLLRFFIVDELEKSGLNPKEFGRAK